MRAVRVTPVTACAERRSGATWRKLALRSLILVCRPDDASWGLTNATESALGAACVESNRQ
jgi:hypothetical protein